MVLPAAKETRHSVCALDCPDCCSLLIDIETTPQGITGSRLRGNPDHPITRGFLCGKVAQYLEREYSPQRLLYPQRRVGAKGEGRFARISWDEALDTIAGRLQRIAAESGSEAILPYSYAGNMGFLNNTGMDRRFFHRLGASQLDRTICSTAGGVALTQSFGIRTGLEPEQFAHSKLIVAWGANIHGTNVHLWPFIVEARRRGAKLYAIDPVATRTAKLADRHWRIHPGTDLALALSLIHVILREGLEDRDYLARHTNGFEEMARLAADYAPADVAPLTGIPADDIVSLARELATVQPAAIRVNYGIQRSERGGAAVRAVSALSVITGSWRHLGGGLQLSTSGGFQVNRASLERPDLQEISLGRPGRVINMTELGKALTAVDGPPVRALIVYNSNPLAIAPNSALVRQGMARDDLFTVVLEQFPTDTADYADVVLPVTTFLENTDLYFAYGHYYLQLARPALPAPGECKSNVDIFRLLAQRMGFTDPCFDESEDDMIRGLLNTDHPYLRGITLEQLEAERHVRLRVAPAGEPFRPHQNGGFPTPSGKFEFGAETLRYTPPVESRHGAQRSRYPLEMVSSKNDDSMNSTFGHRDSVDQQTAVVQMCTADASARGIRDGDRVRVFNDRGSLTLRAAVNGVVGAGVVRIPAVRWAKRAADHQSVNVLTSDRLTDLGGGATFYNCLVEVERCGD
jgi:anaerobic selenocysteine-containing dehydrogenase